MGIKILRGNPHNILHDTTVASYSPDYPRIAPRPLEKTKKSTTKKAPRYPIPFSPHPFTI